MSVVVCSVRMFVKYFETMNYFQLMYLRNILFVRGPGNVDIRLLCEKDWELVRANMCKFIHERNISLKILSW